VGSHPWTGHTAISGVAAYKAGGLRPSSTPLKTPRRTPLVHQPYFFRLFVFLSTEFTNSYPKKYIQTKTKQQKNKQTKRF